MMVQHYVTDSIVFIGIGGELSEPEADDNLKFTFVPFMN